MGPAELLAWYVALHNLGVETSDFGPLFSLFADDAILEFKDPLFGAFKGRTAIKNAFLYQPPSASIVVSGVEEAGLLAKANYADTSDPFVKLGTITLESNGEKIHRMLIG